MKDIYIRLKYICCFAFLNLFFWQQKYFYSFGNDLFPFSVYVIWFPILLIYVFMNNNNCVYRNIIYNTYIIIYILYGIYNTYIIIYILHGLPKWLSGKESACQCRSRRRFGFNPWVGKMPWRRKWQPTPVFLLGESHGQRSLVGYSPWGHKE